MSLVYFSIDAEFSGPAAPKYSLLSFASVAFTLERGVIAELSVNLDMLKDSTYSPETLEFWGKFPEAHEESRKNTVSPEIGMMLLERHVHHTCMNFPYNTSPVFVEFPGGCDFAYLHWYSYNFIGRFPFGYTSFGLKSFYSGILNISVDGLGTKIPKEWISSDLPHTHIALDDAREQAYTAICAMCHAYKKPLPWQIGGTKPGDL